MALRIRCISKRCGLSLACEHAQERHTTENIVDLWSTSAKPGGGCIHYEVRKELNSTADKTGAMPKNLGQSSTLNHSLGGGKKKRPKSKLILPPHLQNPPDLMVKRHIQNGRNINNDEDEQR